MRVEGSLSRRHNKCALPAHRQIAAAVDRGPAAGRGARSGVHPRISRESLLDGIFVVLMPQKQAGRGEAERERGGGGCGGGRGAHCHVHTIDALCQHKDRLQQEPPESLPLKGRPDQDLAQPQPFPVWPGIVVVDRAEAHLESHQISVKLGLMHRSRMLA